MAGQRPMMMGFQAKGADPIVRGAPVEHPQTIASAIQIGNPASWRCAVTARDESGGVIDAVSDEEILEAYGLLASREGVFCEPASAAPVAGLLKLSRQGLDLSGKRVVCVITGTGLKEPELASQHGGIPLVEIEANLEALEEVLALATIPTSKK